MNHLAVSFAFSAIPSKRSKCLEPAVSQAKAFATLTRNGGIKGIYSRCVEEGEVQRYSGDDDPY